MTHERSSPSKHLVVDVPVDLHARVKSKAAIQRISIRQVIIKALREYVYGKKAA
jgi:predicted HicB family RNase H-like nuclease